jgi:hypothetical protein
VAAGRGGYDITCLLISSLVRFHPTIVPTLHVKIDVKLLARFETSSKSIITSSVGPKDKRYTSDMFLNSYD